MKKIKIPFSIIFSMLLIASVVLGFKFFISKTDNKVQKADLIIEKNDIAIKTPGKENYVSVKLEKIEIEDGTYIKSNENGVCHLILSDNSIISIDKNTEIQFNAKKDTIKILQIAGNTWHRVSKLFSKTYEVEANDSIASVRGTRFAVRIVNTDEVHFLVTENSVEILQFEKNNNFPLRKKTLNAGKMLRLKNAELIKKENIELIEEDIPEDLKSQDWYQSNEGFDITKWEQFKDNHDLLIETLTKKNQNENYENIIVCQLVLSEFFNENVEKKFKLGQIDSQFKNQVEIAQTEIKTTCLNKELTTEQKREQIKVILQKRMIEIEKILKLFS